MANVAEAENLRSGGMIGAAVCRSKPLSADGLRERLFTLAFSNLVYAQIWKTQQSTLRPWRLMVGAASLQSLPAAAMC